MALDDWSDFPEDASFVVPVAGDDPGETPGKAAAGCYVKDGVTYCPGSSGYSYDDYLAHGIGTEEELKEAYSYDVNELLYVPTGVSTEAQAQAHEDWLSKQALREEGIDAATAASRAVEAGIPEASREARAQAARTLALAAGTSGRTQGWGALASMAEASEQAALTATKMKRSAREAAAGAELDRILYEAQAGTVSEDREAKFQDWYTNLSNWIAENDPTAAGVYNYITAHLQNEPDPYLREKMMAVAKTGGQLHAPAAYLAPEGVVTEEKPTTGVPA